MYGALYDVINRCNFMLDRADAVRKKTTDDKDLDKLDQCCGEAYFARALAYSELVKLFCKAYESDEDAAGQLGVILSQHYLGDETMRRASLKDSYQFILDDLDRAAELLELEEDFNTDTQGTLYDSIYFNEYTVHALRARVLLYMKRWDEAIKYAKERICFGKPIAKLQAIQFMLADMEIGVETARQMVIHTLQLAEAHLPYGKEAAVAKCYAGDVAFKVAGDAVQVLGGYGYSINRAPLLEILADRAIGLGVDVQYERPVEDAAELSDADLVVVADGANSRIRQQHAEQFGTTVSQGSNPYIWLGTPKVFDKFTFAFEETPAGWIWFHAYPSSEGVSTCIVECTERTWRALGFEEADNAETVRRLEKIFEQPLEGQPLISESRGRPARWLRFTQVYNQTWRHDGMVLVGDAAHTTHFTIGSGTRLAMIDAIMLAQKLYEHGEVDAALKEFDEQGHEALRPVQASARTSMSWFEHADDYLNRNAVDFCYAMAARHGLQPPWQYQRQ